MWEKLLFSVFVGNVRLFYHVMASFEYLTVTFANLNLVKVRSKYILIVMETFDFYQHFYSVKR